GFEVLRTMRERGFDVPVIVYTGTGDFDRCVQAIRLGAYGFIDKAEPMQRVVQEVRNALERPPRGRGQAAAGARRGRELIDRREQRDETPARRHPPPRADPEPRPRAR